MKFILNRDKIVSGTYGHAVRFVKGEPTHVPPEMWSDVQAIGAIPEEEIIVDESGGPREPTDPVTREAALFAIFDKLVAANKPEDFAGTGAPKDKVMEREFGFSITNKEIGTVWKKYLLKDKE